MRRPAVAKVFVRSSSSRDKRRRLAGRCPSIPHRWSWMPVTTTTLTTTARMCQTVVYGLDTGNKWRNILALFPSVAASCRVHTHAPWEYCLFVSVVRVQQAKSLLFYILLLLGNRCNNYCTHYHHRIIPTAEQKWLKISTSKKTGKIETFGRPFKHIRTTTRRPFDDQKDPRTECNIDFAFPPPMEEIQ